jgi:sulfite reductase (NADPH) flavoprotein alpha-component
MLKNILFQMHWLLGITAGIVLAIVGVTGATLSFEHELQRWMNPGVMSVTPTAQGSLLPADLITLVQAAHPEHRVTSLTVSGDPEDAARVGFAAKPGTKRGETRYLDPYSGQLLDKPRGEEFFRFVTQLHRNLVTGDTGKAIVGASTIALVILCLSGLYLRWPRSARNWCTWLTLDFKRTGRGFLWDLHAVAGTWVLLFYLLAALTGLYWSYDWYRDGLFALTGAPRPAQQGMPGKTTASVTPQVKARIDGAPKGGAQNGMQQGHPERSQQMPKTDIDAAWSTFRHEVSQFRTATMRLPEKPGQAVQINYLDLQPAHNRANNRLLLNPQSGAVLEHERYADKPAGAKLMSSMFALHSGSFFGLPGLILMMLASVIMPLFMITGWILYLDRRKKKKALRMAKTEIAPSSVKASASLPELLIGFASQTGFAEQLAWQTAGRLRMAGVPVTVQSLGSLDQDRLSRFRLALFVVSSFGEGEAPDHARPFAKLMREPLSLNGLRFGVLALGDRQYKTFCGFGRALDHWLQRQGAQALFERIEVDNGDAGALKNWQSRLGTLAGVSGTPAWTETPFARWRLHERRLLNPGSCGGPTFQLELEALDATQPDWNSGDLVELKPRHSNDAVTSALAQLNMDGRTLVQADGRLQALADIMARSMLPEPAEIPTTMSAQDIADRLRPLSLRQYSIGSIPADGRVSLLVRQVRHGDDLGVGSGWLTAHAPVGADIEMRIRSNTAFHLPPGDRPLIMLGNGTGLAGLRSHLKARIKAGQGHNWLIFGERNIAHDFYYRDEIACWQKQGMLERVDMVFSRDQPERIYVQDHLRASADMVRAWIADGAAILVCGSHEGMAPGVDSALVAIIGTDGVERLISEGRYRRDVY